MTGMSTDRKRVLDLLAQGRITVDEADQLLTALGGPAQGTSATGGEGSTTKGGARYLRVRVQKTGQGPGKDVNIRIPLALVRSGMKLGAVIPGFSRQQIVEKLRERGVNVDFSKLDQVDIEALLKEMGELTIDVDQGRAQVRVSCE